MAFLPQLDDPSKQVLQFIRERGVVSGWQILSETGVTDQQLLDASKTFMKFSLVSTWGAYRVGNLCRARFTLRPSRLDIVDLAIRA